MLKQDISELKKLYTQNKCSITRICGCYIDGEKNKKAAFQQSFLALPEEEMFKYFEILKKTLSGSIGRNLLTLDFPLAAESEGGTHEFLLRLRDSKLKDETLLDEFYDHIIDAYEYVGNFLILIIHDVYDVPGKTLDGIGMDDASDEIYEYILVSICPVALSKPGLSYNTAENIFQNRIRDWVVNMPETGFLFPAFHDRGADLHSMLYYTKNTEELKDEFVTQLFDCPLPLSAGDQKETFQSIIEETLEETCNIETIKQIHEKLNEKIEAHKDDPELPLLTKDEVKSILADSGVANEKLEKFDEKYDETAGSDTSMLLSNVTSTKTFEVKTPDIVIKVKPERTDLIVSKIINGKECLVIELGGNVCVNGINIKSAQPEQELE